MGLTTWMKDDLPSPDDKRDEEDALVAMVKPKLKVKGTTTFML